MTLYTFRLLSPEVQLRYVLTHGTFLVQRPRVNLYYLPDGGKGFFAEVGIDEARDCFVVWRSFRSAGLLEGYVAGVVLPEGWA